MMLDKLLSVYSKFDEDMEFIIESDTASEQELRTLESDLGVSIPKSLRNTF